MAESVVCEDERHHRFADRHCADADAGVVAAFGHDLGFVAFDIDRLARRENGRGGFHRETDDNRLAGRNPAKNSAGAIGEEVRLAIIAGAHLVGVLFAG